MCNFLSQILVTLEKNNNIIVVNLFQTVPYCTELELEGAKASNLLQILKYARPEWCYIVIAILLSLVQGAVFPAFSLMFTEILNVSVHIEAIYRLFAKYKRAKTCKLL